MASGEYAADLAVEPVEGLSLFVRGLGARWSVVAAARREAMLCTPDMYMRKLIVGPRAKQPS